MADSERFGTAIEECQAIAMAVALIGERYHALKRRKMTPREALADLLSRKKPPAPSVQLPIDRPSRRLRVPTSLSVRFRESATPSSRASMT